MEPTTRLSGEAATTEAPPLTDWGTDLLG